MPVGVQTAGWAAETVVRDLRGSSTGLPPDTVLGHPPTPCRPRVRAHWCQGGSRWRSGYHEGSLQKGHADLDRSPGASELNSSPGDQVVAGWVGGTGVGVARCRPLAVLPTYSEATSTPTPPQQQHSPLRSSSYLLDPGLPGDHSCCLSDLGSAGN